MKSYIKAWPEDIFPRYVIRVYVSPVPEETDTSNNIFELSPVQVIPELPSTLCLLGFLMSVTILLIFAKKKQLKKANT